MEERERQSLTPNTELNLKKLFKKWKDKVLEPVKLKLVFPSCYRAGGDSYGKTE